MKRSIINVEPIRHKQKPVMILAVAAIVMLSLPTSVFAGVTAVGIPKIDYVQLFGNLPNTCDYDWWYGCSPTSAGMMMGHYDRNGYGGLCYPNLVPGGVAESETYVGPPTGWSALANNAIASTGHVADFWGKPDPMAVGHTFDSLADFMGTSQDAYGNNDGWTTFTYYVDGSPFPESASGAGDGMWGVGQYIEYAGYDAATLYNQLIPYVADDLWLDPSGNPIYPPNTLGFTFEQYVAEIDAGRPVMIQVEGHSMFGYGYTLPNIVNVYDTWALGGGSFVWGTSYDGRFHYGVMVLELTDGETCVVIPAPGAILLGSIGVGLVGWLRRRRTL